MLIVERHIAFLPPARSQEVSNNKASFPQTALDEADSKQTAEVAVIGYALKPNKAGEQRSFAWV